jgi:hypothetical protein
MKIEKEVELGSKDVEIFINSEDIRLILDSDGTASIIKCEMNSIAQFLKGIPDKLILQMEHPARESISNFFKEQSERFNNLK